MKKQLVIFGVLAVILIVVAGWMIITGGPGTQNGAENDTSATEAAGDPLEATLQFYKVYLEAVQDQTTDPYAAGVMENPILSAAVRERLAEGRESEVDPVLCQSATPEKIRAKVLFSEGEKAQIQVLGRGEGEKSPEQAVVSLSVVGGAWQIEKIECLYGENAPEREYSFDREGYLLKSVPPPLDSQYWHLVFEQNGQMGHTVPLFFDGNSMCTSLDGTVTVCNEGLFEDAMKSLVQGEMSESGVMVQRLELLPE